MTTIQKIVNLYGSLEPEEMSLWFSVCTATMNPLHESLERVCTDISPGPTADGVERTIRRSLTIHVDNILTTITEKLLPRAGVFDALSYHLQ